MSKIPAPIKNPLAPGNYAECAIGGLCFYFLRVDEAEAFAAAVLASRGDLIANEPSGKKTATISRVKVPEDVMLPILSLGRVSTVRSSDDAVVVWAAAFRAQAWAAVMQTEPLTVERARAIAAWQATRLNQAEIRALHRARVAKESAAATEAR